MTRKTRNALTQVTGTSTKKGLTFKHPNGAKLDFDVSKPVNAKELATKLISFARTQAADASDADADADADDGEAEAEAA